MRTPTSSPAATNSDSPVRCAPQAGGEVPATLPEWHVAEHRGWKIYLDYPPIPDRRFDYQASDPDGDGEPVAYGRTVEDCIADIERILDEREDEAQPFPLAADIPGRPFIHAHRIALNTRDPEMVEAIEARLREVRHIEIAEREPFLSRIGNWSYAGIDWFCVAMLIAAPSVFVIAFILAVARS